MNYNVQYFSCGLISLLAERLHEFKFPGASTIRSITAVERSKEVAPRMRIRVRSDFFCSPASLCTQIFVIYMLMSIKICYFNTFIKPSDSRVFKLANVCNDGYCHCSIYDLFKISFSYELQLLRGSSASLLT